MKPEDLEKVKLAHVRALSLSAADRSQFLRAEFPDQPELVQRVETLLRWHEAAGEFLNTPIAERIRDPLSRDVQIQTVGCWELIRELGSGGSATVFLARRADDLFEKQVAIKVLNRLSHSDDAFRRFQREIQVLARLEHPNIIRLLEAGTTGEALAYIVTEFVKGKRIDEFAAGMRLQEKLRLFIKVCVAVSAAHENLIVHRDIKPSNILVTEDGEPKLLDFGIALLLDRESELTETGLERMTMQYASPEQVRREKSITTASDVYSLGVVLYKLISGRLPYSFPQHEMPARILSDDPAPLAGAPRDLDAITRKALSKNPQDRYASVEGLRADIDRFLDGFPVLARGNDAVYRWKKTFRKYWLPIGVTIIALPILAILTVTFASSAREAQRQSSRVKQLLSDVLEDAAYIRGQWPSLRTREHLETTRASFLRDLMREYPNDLQVARAYHRSLSMLGEAEGLPSTVNLGKTTEARRTFQEAADVDEMLITRWPEDGALKSEAAQTHIKLGSVLMEMGLQEDAQSHFGRAAALTRFLGTSGDRTNLEALAQESRILNLQGSRLEALALRRRIVEARKELFKTEPVSVRWEYAGALCSYGELLREMGQVTAAAAAYSEALPMIETLVRSNAENLENIWHLARENEEYGRVQLELNSIVVAQDHFERAVALYRTILQKEPHGISNKRSLAVCLHWLGTIAVRRGARAKGIRLLQEAETLSAESAALDTGSAKAQIEFSMIRESLIKTRGY